MIGAVGTGTCGTSSTDAKDCAVKAEGVTAGTTLADLVNIGFTPPSIP
jgi:hypothetical protein